MTYHVDEILRISAEFIRCFGYHKSCENNSTRDLVVKCIENPEDVYLNQHLKDYDFNYHNEDSVNLATNAFDWVLQRHPEKVDSYEYKVRKVCLYHLCDKSDIGLLAYLPLYYKTTIAREKERYERQQRYQLSNYQGREGEKLSFIINTVEVSDWYNTRYGMSRVYTFTDNDNNVYVWFTSKDLNINPGTEITGTVKTHTEFDNIKRTTISRCVFN